MELWPHYSASLCGSLPLCLLQRNEIFTTSLSSRLLCHRLSQYQQSVLNRRMMLLFILPTDHPHRFIEASTANPVIANLSPDTERREYWFS